MQRRRSPKCVNWGLIFLGSALLSIVLISCDSLRNEVDPDRLNRQAGKLVVVSFLSPQDTIIAVSVSQTTPVLTENRPVSGFTGVTGDVTISNGTKLIALKYDPNYNKQNLPLYWASARDFPIVAGQTYTLTVETSDGRKATSQCTIPAAAPAFGVELDSAVVSNGYYAVNGNRTPFYAKEYSLQTQWLDLVGGRNYYRTAAVLRTEARVPSSTSLTQLNLTNTGFENYGLKADGPSTDGQKLTSSEGVYYRYSDNQYTGAYSISGPTGTTTVACPVCATVISNPTGTTVVNPPSGTNPPATQPDDIAKFRFGSNLRSAVLTVSLLHTDENYYRYHEAITRQSNVDGNPFAEPVHIQSNISGGLGCFAGYNRRSVVIRLK